MQKVSKILSIAIILSITALQAGVSVSGTVTSDNGEPLAYANVTVVGTNVGTASSEDGSYTLDLPSNFTAGQSVTLTAGTDVFNLFKTKAVGSNTTVELLTQPLIIQENEILKAQAATGNRLHMVVSVLQINRD